jgi:hypothetical protein
MEHIKASSGELIEKRKRKKRKGRGGLPKLLADDAQSKLLL